MTTVRDQLVGMIDRALGDDPKAALAAARQLEEECDWLVRRAVSLARREGWNWARIGRMLGLTRHGARKRFPATPPFAPPSTIVADRAARHDRETERLVRDWDRHRKGRQPAGGASGSGADADDDDEPVAW